MNDHDPKASGNTGGEVGLVEAEMRDAIARVIESDLFSNTPRLREFLEYVANESIAGSKEKLRAKSIAFFVYQRDPVDERSSANVVRVEARRLRRLLEDYYETEGRDDSVRVYIDKGGYAPRFERQAHFKEKTKQETVIKQYSTISETRTRDIRVFQRKRWQLGAIGVICVTALSVVVTQLNAPQDAPADRSLRDEREALMERSPAALEAANLTAQARGLIYPVFDAERQRLTTELFRAAIEVDPNSAEAHAGAAQTLASQALLSLAGPQHDMFLAEANQMLERALELNASLAWTQSAAGWVAYVGGDYDAALRFSKRAASLAPNDGNVLDFYGVIAIMSGEWETAIDAASQSRAPLGANTRYADQNILAAARFHMGEYGEAARLIEANSAEGGPMSAPVVMYLAATYQAMDRERDGQRILALLNEDWPGIPAERILKRLHRDDENAMSVVNRLRALGWDR